jgi:spermidine synthase
MVSVQDSVINNVTQRLEEALNDHSGVYFNATARLASFSSSFQTIEVWDTRELGRVMRIDGANMVSERDEFFYHEALIHPAAIAHDGPKRALIVGGGDGGAAEELAKHPSIEKIVLCELDGAVIDIAKEYLQSVHRNVFDNEKLSLVIGDGLAYVRSASEQYDLIYLDLTDPIGPTEALYSQTFYRDCANALLPGGALTLHIGSPFSHPDRVRDSVQNLRAVFAKVIPYFVHIPMYGATWGFAFASQSLDIGTPAVQMIEQRLAGRKITHRQFYNGEVHHAMQAKPEYIKTLIE